MEILQELNEKQQQAATHTKGAILVVAGPGTGKSKVITHRIAHLIRRHHVPPQQIFAVTFTNKAAQEMLERVKVLLGTTQGLDVRIHTFHAFCVNLLREHAPEIGLIKNFTIFDQETQDEVLIECLRELKLNRLDYPPWLLRDIIGAYKVKLESPITEQRHEIHTGDGTVIDHPVVIENITALLKAYQSKLAYHNALDFDDLIFKSVEVLEQSPSVRAGYHNAIRFILVDEYQDINVSQYALLKHLCRVHIVGELSHRAPMKRTRCQDCRLSKPREHDRETHCAARTTSPQPEDIRGMPRHGETDARAGCQVGAARIPDSSNIAPRAPERRGHAR